MLADPVAAPEAVGLSSERLRRVQPLFETYINNELLNQTVIGREPARWIPTAPPAGQPQPQPKKT